ncbi:uncharacterized protein [Dermacentor albipictus]|uniref:uncharacterized protein isoform X6 n=1 Tax=Dermacentor albipictus TaxID=60249 RepID=UPI0038FC608F
MGGERAVDGTTEQLKEGLLFVCVRHSRGSNNVGMDSRVKLRFPGDEDYPVAHGLNNGRMDNRAKFFFIGDKGDVLAGSGDDGEDVPIADFGRDSLEQEQLGARSAPQPLTQAVELEP